MLKSYNFEALNKDPVMKIAIFASGAGSNAKKIIEYINGKENKSNNGLSVSLVVCNKPGAGVIKIAEEKNIPVLMIEKEKFFRGNGYADELEDAGIGFIVLAGFLWKLPVSLIKAYPKRIINIHPALLPKYGGKGMYGRHVHEAVLASGDTESGITIHYVDEVYDHGQNILQVKCMVKEDDTPETLAERIHSLEHRHFPPSVAFLASL